MKKFIKYVVLCLVSLSILFPSQFAQAETEQENYYVTVKEAQVLVDISEHLDPAMSIEFEPKKKYFAFNLLEKEHQGTVELAYEGNVEALEAWNGVIEAIINVSDYIFSELDGSYTVVVTNHLNKDLVILKVVGDEITYNLMDEKASEQIPVASQPTTTVTREQENALKEAESYLSFMPFSKQGLYDQLTYAQYPADAAQYAIDNITANWNQNALESAESYLEFMPFSDGELYDQLIYEGFTDSEAQYAIDNLD